MKKLFLALFVLCITVSYGLCSTMNSYDSYGRKGSYRTNGNTTTSYDSYGRRTGTIRETSSGYNMYDSYGRKTSTVRKTSTGYNTYDSSCGDSLSAVKKRQINN